MSSVVARAAAKQRLVILGTGWASFAVMRKIDAAKFDVVVVSERNHFLFTPLLASAAVGTLEFRAVAESVRQVRPDVAFHQGSCTAIDAAKKTVTVRDAFSGKSYNYSFDQLVIGTGAESSTFGVPGAKEHAHFLKSLADARRIRQTLLQNLEQASNPYLDDAERRRLCSIVIVGGGPTCIEVAGELSDALREARKYYPESAHLVQMTVVEAASELLTSFDSSLGAYVRKTFKRRHVDVLTNARVTAVEPTTVTVNMNGNLRQLEYGLCVWSTGIGPTPFLQELPFEKVGWRLKVDPMLRLPAHPNIYAIGDCSASGLPSTAQVANQEGLFVAKALNSDGNVGTTAFAYRHAFSLAYIGSYSALVDTGPDGHVHTKGFAAFLVWRLAYWTSSVSWRNKLAIPFFWFKSFVLGRDFTRF